MPIPLLGLQRGLKNYLQEMAQPGVTNPTQVRFLVPCTQQVLTVRISSPPCLPKEGEQAQVLWTRQCPRYSVSLLPDP